MLPPPSSTLPPPSATLPPPPSLPTHCVPMYRITNDEIARTSIEQLLAGQSHAKFGLLQDKHGVVVRCSNTQVPSGLANDKNPPPRANAGQLFPSNGINFGFVSSQPEVDTVASVHIHGVMPGAVVTNVTLLPKNTAFSIRCAQARVDSPDNYGTEGSSINGSEGLRNVSWPWRLFRCTDQGQQTPSPLEFDVVFHGHAKGVQCCWLVIEIQIAPRWVKHS
jgi:hypothetical protein